MNKKVVEKLEEILMLENPWVKHYYDKVRFPNGEEGQYNRIVEGNQRRGVVILPFNNKKELGLLKIYRYPIGSWQWEAPRGYGEASLTTEENAARELKEEMAMEAEEFVYLGSIYPNSGLLSTEADILLARNIKNINEPLDKEKGTISEIRFFNISSIKDMIGNGSIKDGFTISGLFLAWFKNIIKL
jgi:ADP-ribose pyrophosphatase